MLSVRCFVLSGRDRLRRFPEVLVCYLPVVLRGDGLCVAEPSADNVERKLYCQFGLASAAEILEQPGARLDSSQIEKG